MNEGGADSNVVADVVDGLSNVSTTSNNVPTTGMISINTTSDNDNSKHTYLLQSLLSYVGNDNYTNSENSLLRQILLYVGNYQYRFVALVNHKFYDTYVTVHSNNNKLTYYNTSTVNHTMICYHETQRNELQYLYKTAFKYNNSVDTLQYLVSQQEGMTELASIILLFFLVLGGTTELASIILLFFLVLGCITIDIFVAW
jgi:hypothetical protein